MGPILFIIYMNDVIENIKHSKIRLFADDIIQVYYTKKLLHLEMPNNFKKIWSHYNYGKVHGYLNLVYLNVML